MVTNNFSKIAFTVLALIFSATSFASSINAAKLNFINCTRQPVTVNWEGNRMSLSGNASSGGTSGVISIPADRITWPEQLSVAAAGWDPWLNLDINASGFAGKLNLSTERDNHDRMFIVLSKKTNTKEISYDVDRVVFHGYALAAFTVELGCQ